MRLALAAACGLALAGTAHAQAQAQAQDIQSAVTMVPQPSVLLPVARIEQSPQTFGALANHLKTNHAMMFAPGEIVAIAPTDQQVVSAAATNCGASMTGLSDGWKIFAYNLDRNAALALNIFGPMELAATDKVIVYHFMWYKDVQDSDGSVVGRCGAGVELVLKSTSLNGSIEVSLPAIAASTQLGQSQVQYSLSTFGLSGTAINAAIPQASTVGKFDTQAYAVLMGAIDKIQAAGAAGTSVTFAPRLVAMPGSGASTTEIDEALIRVTALRHIARGSTCSVARAAIPGRTTTTDGIVDNFYRGFARPGVCGALGGVNASERQRAGATLTRFGLAAN